ncbi:hypothetical protein E8E13_000921 [Curvularia kusanoi]|uniref:FAD-binding domain-containing protein n=1 Tax=Curvularia kusanoi TaxID=90978 RepID=A0A9P4T2Y8_CURKU|nr:hypothetical protein E8E13_000921 [Curvularia kusanoi]
MVEIQDPSSLAVTVVGAGIGGLVCAIACRREGLSVQVLEQASEIRPIGAGIQVPSNASRVLLGLGLLEAVKKEANEVKMIKALRYSDGKLLNSRPVGRDDPWMVIHRADYHKVLMNEAKSLGVKITLDVRVVDIDLDAGVVALENGKTVTADVVVGADGLWSVSRSKMLGSKSEPFATGDLAYRGTFSLEQLQQLNDPRIGELCKDPAVTVWFGPSKHCVFYPIRNSTQFNLVLIRPDDLPADARTVQGDIDEMRDTFVGWDSVLTKIISCIPTVLKWKLMHNDELDQWTKGCAVLLGDACHPTLPYQAQGAAMAVEDGAIIGRLLGRLGHELNRGVIPMSLQRESIKSVLKLYEKYQKSRSTTNVKGAISNRYTFHLPDGPEQEARDSELARHTWTEERSNHMWCDMAYNKELLGTDSLKNANALFDDWLETVNLKDEKYQYVE